MVSNPATEEAALTQQMNDADAQAAASAQVMHANALATLNSASSTLSAAQTQAQNAADVLAAQMAATAQIVRANAQATLNAAEATQNAARTQDSIHQTQTAALSTSDAQAALDQKNKDQVAANTQTAIANLIATQTQSAAATAQWYVAQDRQRGEQTQSLLAFWGLLCLPIFIVLFVVSALWAYWRWVKIQQGPRILENPVEKLPAPTAEIIDHRQADAPLYLETDLADHLPHLTTPDDQQMGRWLDEVKSELQNTDKKDKDDGADNG